MPILKMLAVPASLYLCVSPGKPRTPAESETANQQQSKSRYAPTGDSLPEMRSLDVTNTPSKRPGRSGRPLGASASTPTGRQDPDSSRSADEAGRPRYRARVRAGLS